MPSLTGSNWTVEMLDALPDDGQRYEIIDGELFVTPSPARPHQIIVGAIFAELRAYLRGTNVGYAMISPSDVSRGERKKNRVQPDVFVARFIDGRKAQFPFAMRDLLLAVEVISPGNPRYDYQVKRQLYLSEGVPEYWVVDGDARNLSRWRSAEDPGEVFSKKIEWQPAGMSSPFTLDLAELFAEAYD